jgi:hypothetical protein
MDVIVAQDMLLHDDEDDDSYTEEHDVLLELEDDDDGRSFSDDESDDEEHEEEVDYNDDDHSCNSIVLTGLEESYKRNTLKDNERDHSDEDDDEPEDLLQDFLAAPIQQLRKHVAFDKSYGAESYNRSSGPKPETQVQRPKPPKEREVVHKKGLEFDMCEPWQRSLLREIERKEMEKDEDKDKPNKKKGPQHASRHGRMMVGHTESRDYGIQMCDSGTFSLMTDGSSIAPATHTQIIHRNRPFHQDDDSTLFGDDGSHDDTEKRSSWAPTPSGDASPRGVHDELHHHRAYDHNNNKKKEETVVDFNNYNNDDWLELEASKLQREYSYRDFNDDATAITYATAEGQKEACHCFGYNVMDMILPPHHPRRKQARDYRASRRLNLPQSRLEKVRETTSENEYSNSRDNNSFTRWEQPRPDTPESRSGQESAFRSRPIKETQSRDPDGVYLDHYGI